MTKHLIITVIGATLMLGACSNNLFFADFESGTPGVAPLSDPPGPPIGDSISFGPSNVSFVSSDAPVVGSQSLTIHQELPKPDPGGRIIFRTIPIGDTSLPIYAFWRGRFAGPGGITVNVGFLGESFGNVSFFDGEISVAGEPVGTYDVGETHTVIISLFPQNGVYRFAIFGGTTIDEGFIEADLNPIDSTPQGEAFIDVSVTLSSAQNVVYVMDEVTVSTSEPSR